jgi:hypothetical protein
VRSVCGVCMYVTSMWGRCERCAGICVRYAGVLIEGERERERERSNCVRRREQQ